MERGWVEVGTGGEVEVGTGVSFIYIRENYFTQRGVNNVAFITYVIGVEAERYSFCTSVKALAELYMHLRIKDQIYRFDKLATPESGDDSSFRMAIVGATGVGKTALIHQFRTSECINAYDCNPTDESEQAVSILLNGMESEIVFVNVATNQDFQEEINRERPTDGWLIMYSITDKASFQKAGEELGRLHSRQLLRGRAVILVANKCELVRSRAVTVDDGRDLACSYGGKFMEISVGMNHKCDDLLVGILNQLRIKGEAEPCEEEEAPKEKTWTRGNRSLLRASMKAKRVINRIMGKTEAKYKNCEDFQS
ncbi:ras-like protein rasG [Homarus americanus]|uniref:ras-like protein rasG n=1 Tax=Homarus americanus TaxID=6706 RepID=UPI001C491697|nr:ras-like protein rasG [Homarus americanus]